MLLSAMRCDGCGRKPTLSEWIRGELTAEGYPDWRHPGLVFRECGLPLTPSNEAKIAYLFHAMYGRPLPLELSYLCPQCQEYAEEELPALSAAYRGDPAGDIIPTDRRWMGE